jgi:hypothetical protein
MKLTLGPSKREKADTQRYWHPWFAWVPIRLEYRHHRGFREGRWLETVMRRRTNGVEPWEYISVREWQEQEDRRAEYVRG